MIEDYDTRFFEHNDSRVVDARGEIDAKRDSETINRNLSKKESVDFRLDYDHSFSFVTIGFSYLISVVIDAAIDGERALFMNFLLISVGLMMLNFFLSYARTRLLFTYTEVGMKTLRSSYGQKIASISFEGLSQVSSGELLSRGTNDMTRVRQFTSTTLPRLIEIPLTGLLALGMLLYFSWQLTLISLVMVPVLVIGSSFLMSPIAKASKRAQAKLGQVNALSIDVIKGSEAVKAYHLEEKMKFQGHAVVEESVFEGTKVAKKRAVLESFSMGFSIVPFVTTFVLGGWFVVNGMMTAGGLLAFINLLNFLTMPLSQMTILVGESKRDLASLERIYEIIDAEEERTDGTKLPFLQQATMVEVKDVSFTYADSEHPVIDGLSLTIKPFETVAFVGPSGGGKSTLAKLLLGYYDTYQGSIHIGGHELRAWSLEGLRQQIAMVSQDTFLFPDTVYENIRMGRVDATEDDIILATQQANAKSFILAMEKEYHTILSEHGSSLSGGQKQRLAIARAILKEAPILLLDEATSALDTESETVVQEAFASLAKEKTTIIIAHRLSTVQEADRVYVIDQGRVVEQGSPSELLAKDGLYAKLYRKQILEDTEAFDNVDYA